MPTVLVGERPGALEDQVKRKLSKEYHNQAGKWPEQLMPLHL